MSRLALFSRCETGPHKMLVDGKVIKQSAQSDFFGNHHRREIVNKMRAPEGRGVLGLVQMLWAMGK